jgi:hypothetical protein
MTLHRYLTINPRHKRYNIMGYSSTGFNPQALLRNALEWVNGLGVVGAFVQRTLQHSIVSKISGVPKVLFILVQ